MGDVVGNSGIGDVALGNDAVVVASASIAIVAVASFNNVAFAYIHDEYDDNISGAVANDGNEDDGDSNVKGAVGGTNVAVRDEVSNGNDVICKDAVAVAALSIVAVADVVKRCDNDNDDDDVDGDDDDDDNINDFRANDNGNRNDGNTDGKGDVDSDVAASE